MEGKSDSITGVKSLLTYPFADPYLSSHPHHWVAVAASDSTDNHLKLLRLNHSKTPYSLKRRRLRSAQRLERVNTIHPSFFAIGN